MTDNDLPRLPAAGTPDVAEQNLERLLEKAYKPEALDPDFVQRVRERLAVAARERSPAVLPLRRPMRRRVFWVLVAAAAVAGLAFLLNALATPVPEVKNEKEVVQDGPRDDQPPPPPIAAPGTEELGPPRIDGAPVPQALAHLTPRERPAAPEGAKLAVGDTLRTQAGERRRVVLPDGSVVYLNQKTEVKLEAERRLTLSAGEVYVEVAPRPVEDGDTARFVVRTPKREVTALGTRFEVSAFELGTGVTVTQGRVRVSGLDEVLRAGQQLAPDAQQPTAAPRAAAALAWTRELMCAEEAPLVPPSKYAGGALVVNDTSGQPEALSLRKYHVDVHIEDGFARTTIDQTYFNANQRRLEGTFHFPLPPDASLSRLAMYVNGQLMEGGMAERDFARQTFESIVRKMQDPALLEWVDGSTFKMRVFPLEARQEKRIVLSYTQRLPVQYGRTPYRFPAGHSLDVVRDWSFHATVKNSQAMTWSSDTHPDLLRATTAKGDLLLDAEQHNVKVEGDVAIDLFDGDRTPLSPRGRGVGGEGAKPSEPSTPQPNPSPPRGEGLAGSARFSSMDHDGARYFMVRYRPDLPTAKQRQRRDWIFLFESSGDRDPLLARTQIEVIRTLLTNAEHDDTFAIITAATRAASFATEPKPATAENIEAAARFLDRTHLIGLLDLGKALNAAEPFLKAAQNPYLVHVGSGHAALGETKADALVRRLPEGVHYVGVGVGKRWNRALMKAAAERSSGYFTQINPDEAINWRSFELFSALTTPRLLGVKVVDNAEKATFLSQTSAVTQGEEICAMTRLEAGAALPQTVTVTGTLDGKTFTRSVPVKDVSASAGYLPRTWARLEIDRLLAENAAANKARIVQLSMASYVMTPFTSLLVLENEQMYAQFGVDRGRKDHWAMYPCPNTIPVLPPEPLDGQVAAVKATPTVKPSAEQVLETILIHVPPRAFAEPGTVPLAAAVTARDLYTGAFGVPISVVLDGFGKDRRLGYLMDFDDDSKSKISEETARIKDSPKDSSARDVSKPTALPQTGPIVTSGVPISMPATGGGGAALPPSPPPGEVPGGIRPPMGPGMGNGAFSGFSGFGGGGLAGMGGGFGLSGSNSFTGGGFGGGQFGGGGFSGSGSGYGGPGPMGRPGPQAPFGTVNATTYAPAFLNPPMGWMVPGATGNNNPYYNYFRLYSDAGPAGSPKTGLKDPGAELPRLRDTEKESETVRFLQWKLGTDPRLRDQLETALRRHLDMAETGDLVKRRVKEPRKGDGKELDKLDDQALIRLAEQLEVLQSQSAAERAARLRPAAPVSVGAAGPDALLYRRPTFAPDGRLFTDLVAFAPGLNTSQADILGVLEAEAAADPSEAPGTIEPAARALIEGARAAGWRTLTVPAAAGAPAWSVAFDGSGRFAYERVLSCGLREHVICDGKELLHLYPELGLGARRSATRFHRAELSHLVPWALPPARDLAHGYDLKVVGERIVARVPAGLKADQFAVVTQLVFADDGRLAERRLVALPKKTVLHRETYATDGTVKVLDGDNKELSERKLALKAGGAPELDPVLMDLVVLPMPLRTREHLNLQPGAAGGNLALMDDAACLRLMACDAAVANSPDLQLVIQSRGWSLGDTYPGFTTLLLSAGMDVGTVPPPPGNNRSLVGRYVLQLKQPEPRPDPNEQLGGLLSRLSEVQSLLRRWQQAGVLEEGDCARMVKYVRQGKSPVFVWAVVEEVLRTPDKMVTAAGGRAQVQRDVLEAACASLKDVPVLSYAARYEFARHLAENGERAEARKQFVRLYEESAKDGVLPPLERGFRQALASPGRKPGESSDDQFAPLLRDHAARLVKDGRRIAAVALAWQCWELEAPALADEVLATALAGLPKDRHRAAPTLAAVECLSQTHQYDRADQLLQGLLDDPQLAQHAGLWRLGYQVALQRKNPARAFTCLAQALELEYRARPVWIDVQAVRNDYGALLTHYAEVVRATATLGEKPPADLAAKVVRAADRWRALDIDGAVASGPAFQGLRGLGEWDLAWDYLLMSVGVDKDGFSWANLAQSLQQSEDFDLAERAYAQACLVEPANANLARARADNLMQAGRGTEGRDLIRRIGDGPVLPAEPVKPPQVP